jgi:APA family basic amino acid/polyamine antiporter
VATVILIVLFVYRPSTTWPGLLIVLLGVPIYLVIRKPDRGLEPRSYAQSETTDFEAMD